jgi:hypothetical protein
MRGRLLATCAIASVVLGCAPAPSPTPSPTQPPTQPPVPADVIPWPDIVWSVADGVAAPDPGDGEQAVAVTAGPEGFVAVGYRDVGPIRDGLAWFSRDGQTWSAVGAPGEFDGVEMLDVTPSPDGFVALGVGTLGAPAERPHAVFFSSPDGRTWQRLAEVPGSAGAYPGWLTGGKDGVIAVGSDVNDATVVWRSVDGLTFEEVPIGGPAGDAVTDPHATARGYVALGSESGPPVLLRSDDGTTWEPTQIDATPDVVATRLVPGRWGYVVQGLWAPKCAANAANAEDPACAEQPIGWWSGDGTSWARLPEKDSPVGNGGSIIVGAGEHGVLAIDGASAWASPDGWAWRPLPEPGDGSMAVADAVVAGDVIVAVGATYGDDGVGRSAIVVANAPTVTN